MIATMLLVVGIWITLAVWCVALGRSILASLRSPARDLTSSCAAFWVGWGALVAALQLWHVCLPVNGVALAFLGVIGCAALAVHARQLRTIAGSCFRQHPGFCVLVAVVAVWLANRALAPIDGLTDAGLYHLAALRWARSFALVPGLGNLHARFAFDSSYFQFLAVLDDVVPRLRGYNLVPGLLILAALAQTLRAAGRVLGARSGDPASAHDVLAVVLVAPLVTLAMARGASTYADVPVFVLGVVVSLHLFHACALPSSSATRRLDLFLVVFLSAIGITIKLSLVAMGAVAAATAMVLWCVPAEGGDGMPRVPASSTMLMLLPGALVLAVWMGRGVVLSGYPAYPLPVGAVDVAWRLPHDDAAEMVRIIRSWARWPYHAGYYDTLDTWRWFWPWVKRATAAGFRPDGVVCPLVLLVIGLAALVVLRRRLSAKDGVRLLIPVVPAACGTVFWFLIAPDPRFAGAALFVLGSGGLAAAVTLVRLPRQRWAVGFLVGFDCWFVLVTGWVHGFVVWPGPAGGLYPLPVAALEERRTASGLVVWVPVDSDQCWDAPLPCTPSFNPRLRLRWPDELGSGFVVDSAGG